MEDPNLPPLLTAVPLDAGNAFDHACRHAEALGAGSLVWVRTPERLDCAVVLEPEAPRDQILTVFHAAMVALAEALGWLAPPVKPVQFAWPDGIVVDGACVGGLRLASGPEEDGVPRWLVIGAELAVLGEAAGDGRTTLWEEGFGDIAVPELVGSFGRYLLSWLDRWQADGYRPVRAAWLARAIDVADLDAAGAALAADGSRRPLPEALTAPSWRP